MRGGRLFLVVTTLIVIVFFPLLLRDALQASSLPSAFAATPGMGPGGRVYANGNNDDNDNRNGNNNKNNNNNNNDSGDNDNEACFLNLNSNEEVPCDNNGNGNSNNNDNRGRNRGNGNGQPQQIRRDFVSMCFDVEMVGVLQLIEDGGDITFLVPPSSGYPQITRISLRKVDPSSQPAVPGTLVGGVMFSVDGQNGCDGPAITALNADANLGITYHASADKSRVKIMRLVNGSWTEVTTVPDPGANNPYVSTTIHDGGVYALVQR